ncbi:MAG TPA: BON domain-containing protein [Pyrinomonadaceae bacterium]|nr:BON domain-containing protein [Pyrinomonadaceae bacterium]
MRKRNSRMVVIMLMAVSLFTPAFLREGSATSVAQVDARLVKRIRHELATLPYYGVFDWLQFEVRANNTVVLRGEVVRPTTKSDAEARVKDIDGVRGVINEIQVLPVSPQDDRLRLALYRTLYSWDSPLFRYATQSIPPIHIIVDHGRATLKGIVDSKADAQLAYMRARSVPGLFDVKSDLVVSSEGAQ